MQRTVLIVDDSSSMRQMLSFTLKEAGFAVHEGVDGKDGLVKLDGHSFDLVITDLNMPNMDGITFIRNIRQRQAHKFTPVLMLTTESDAGKKAEGKSAGATGWLVKPFNPPQLLQTIAKVLP